MEMEVAVTRTAANVGRPRSERSRRAVLDAAAALLRKRGYADVTIEGIAAEAGVGKTTIYRWWATKASIYMDLYAELAISTAPPPDTGDFAEDLRVLIRGGFKLYRETAAGPALAGIVAEAQSNAAVLTIVRNEFAPSRRHVLLSILERAAKRGQIPPDVELELVAEIIAGAVWYNLLVAGDLTDEHATRLIDRVVQGVRPKIDLASP